jgi:hypothetical protein
MAKITKTDEFKERLNIEMDHIKAGLMELKAKGRKAKLEARLDFDKGVKTLEKAQADLKGRMKEWAKTGGQAGTEVRKGLAKAAKDLKKAVGDAASRLKQS